MSDKMKKRRAALYEEIQDIVTAALTNDGIPDDVAEIAAVGVVNALAEHWGGSLISFPKDIAYILSSRDEAIYQKFNGTNHSELAAEYGLCEATIYRIVKRCQRQYIERAQPNLF